MVVIFGIICVIVFCVGLSDGHRRRQARKTRKDARSDQAQQSLRNMALSQDLDRQIRQETEDVKHSAK
ncbi:MAG: hypothetical protein FWF45_06545 [Coriobacteriia bacterium]|nr:hypothetical protein [Coriobacteriia bacterium]